MNDIGDFMEEQSSRRRFLRTAAVGAASAALTRQLSWAEGSAVKHPAGKPNLVFIFADQWRAQATGYAGNKDVKTPHLDRLAKQSVNFSNAVSGCPVCTRVHSLSRKLTDRTVLAYARSLL